MTGNDTNYMGSRVRQDIDIQVFILHEDGANLYILMLDRSKRGS